MKMSSPKWTVIAGIVALAGCGSPSFDALDKNHDGQLTADEIPAAQRDAFYAADLVGNGFITRDEFPQFKRALDELRDRGNLEIIRDIPYAGTDNPHQRLDLGLPRDRKTPLPLIVFIHGGSWRHGDKRGGYWVLAPFARDGRYALATIEYRFTQETTWPSQIHDCKAAIRWLRANAPKYGIDPNRIGIWGHSAGGQLVSMLGLSAGVPEMDGNVGHFTNMSTAVSCVADYSGPQDFITLAHSTNMMHFGAADSVESKLLGGRADERPEVARAASPVLYATSNAPPFLIVHGEEDNIVPIAQAEELYSALQAAHPAASPVFLRVADTKHFPFGDGPIGFTRRFFDKHLLGESVELESKTIKN